MGDGTKRRAVEDNFAIPAKSKTRDIGGRREYKLAWEVNEENGGAGMSSIQCNERGKRRGEDNPWRTNRGLLEATESAQPKKKG